MQSQQFLLHKPSLTVPVKVKAVASPKIRPLIRNSASTPQVGTADLHVSFPNTAFGLQGWNVFLLSTGFCLAWAVSQVDLEQPIVLGIVAAAVLTESQWLIEPLRNILRLRTSQNGVTYKDQIIEGQLVNAFKPSQTQDSQKKDQIKTKEISKEETEEEEWMDQEIPSEITEDYTETESTIAHPKVKEEGGSQNDKEVETKVFDMQEYDEQEKEASQTITPHSIVIGYETSWPKAILHGSINGGGWGDLAECEEEKSFSVDVEDEESESIPLLEFVITDGNGDWDHSCDGQNYSIFKAGSYQLKDGVLTPLE